MSTPTNHLAAVRLARCALDSAQDTFDEWVLQTLEAGASARAVGAAAMLDVSTVVARGRAAGFSFRRGRNGGIRERS